MIETVDSFQGKQLDVVILSCVRAARDAGSPRNVGFVSDLRRLNVVRAMPAVTASRLGDGPHGATNRTAVYVCSA
jgi:superfamily I DNA and/or RNA helicase